MAFKNSVADWATTLTTSDQGGDINGNQMIICQVDDNEALH